MKKLFSKSSTKIANLLIVTVIILVPFHAFLTVWASTFIGHFTLLRLWDEIILTLLVVITLIFLLQDRELRQHLYKSTLVRLIAAYSALTVILGIYSLAHHSVSLKALGYGLTINLRFFIWFICIWLICMQSAWLKTHWRNIILWPLVVVVVFGLLQFFVLPHDFLTHFGYGKNTFVPFVTINQNTTTIRVQSFLRGANPLGAYLAAMVGILVGLVNSSKINKYIWLLFAGTLLALFVSFSRSGWLGAFIAVIVGIGLRLRTKKQRIIGAVSLVIIVSCVGGGYLLLQHNTSVQDAVLHVSSRSTATQTSNEGHFASLKQSLRIITHQPFGEGPGTSGQASWYNTGHSVRNTESYFLQIGEEVGLLGLALFIAILVKVGQELWYRKDNALSLGLLAGLFGLVFITQLSYAWSDDTLAYIWWGLAAIAISTPNTLHKSAAK